MENELRIIAGLTAEQVAERASALALEVTYWQHVLDDATAVNDAVLTTATALLESTASVLILMAVAEPSALPLVQSIVDQNRAALDAVKSISDTLSRTIDLADGRQKSLEPVGRALRRAAGLEVDAGLDDEVEQ
jgi:hypothetical protein